MVSFQRNQNYVIGSDMNKLREQTIIVDLKNLKKRGGVVIKRGWKILACPIVVQYLDWSV